MKMVNNVIGESKHCKIVIVIRANQFVSLFVCSDCSNCVSDELWALKVVDNVLENASEFLIENTSFLSG